MCGFYSLVDSILETFWKILGKRPFFRADTAGLGKYCTGGYGRIGVYRVKVSVLAKLPNSTCLSLGEMVYALEPYYVCILISTPCCTRIQVLNKL